jgi:hypothetical protein
MRTKYFAIALGIAVLAVTALGACGGGDDSSPNTLVAKKGAPSSLAADDAAWGKASAITIKTGVIEGSKAAADVEVSAKALYSGDDIWFRFEWADATESTARVWTWDGSAWKSSGNEDRLSLYWEITPIDKFQTRGCAVLCHNPDTDPIDKWYMIAPGVNDRADNWHWKAARTNPVGQADDKYLIGELTDPEDIESANKGDAKDKGGYKDNKAKDGKGPAMMQDPSKPPSAGEGVLLVSEAVALDVSKLKPGDTIPRELLEPWTGSRGDIEAKGTWANGKWTVVLHRKLDTGHEDDVKLVTGKTFPFGLAVHDNAGAVNHTVSSDVYLLKFD